MRFPAGSRTVQFLMPVLIGSCFNLASGNQAAPGPTRVGSSLILDGITNVATSATHFLSGVVQRQKELLHHVADSATDYVANAVEKPRNLLMNTAAMTSNYKLGIPILEPLQLYQLYLETHNPEIGELKILLENATISGLTSFVIDRARLSLIGPTIAMNLTIPKLYVDGYYNLSGVIGDMFHIHGAGPLTATITDFRIFFETVLGYSRGMYLKSFDLDFSVGHIEINLGNFMGGSKVGTVMNEVLQNLLPQAIEIIKPEILPHVQDYIASRVNDTIYHLTMRDVLSFLIGENEIRKYPHLLHP